MKISVFAASSSRIENVFFNAARELGKLIAEKGWEVVFGGGGIGLMGALSDSALAHGGGVTGVIPGFMLENGWANAAVDKMIITETMSERKQKIFEISDAVVALPGGIGTLEELAEAITLKQLGLFKGPVVILNIADFYDPFIKTLQHLIAGNFMRDVHSEIWHITGSVPDAMDYIATYKGWLDNPQKIAKI